MSTWRRRKSLSGHGRGAIFGDIVQDFTDIPGRGLDALLDILPGVHPLVVLLLSLLLPGLGRLFLLLRDLGYVLDDVTSGGGYDPDDGGSGGSEMSRREIIDQMLANAQAYQSASKEEQDRLYKENQRLGASIDGL